MLMMVLRRRARRRKICDDGDDYEDENEEENEGEDEDENFDVDKDEGGDDRLMIERRIMKRVTLAMITTTKVSIMNLRFLESRILKKASQPSCTMRNATVPLHSDKVHVH